jgi:LPXTG-motif cell wall-anchored protein
LLRSEENRHPPALLVAYTVDLASSCEGAESPWFVTIVQSTVMTQAALAKHTGEKMDTTTLIVIVLVVLLLGGGGFFYRRRV